VLKSAGLAVILLAAMAIAPPSVARDPAAAPAAGIDRETITPDPAVRRGVLANGLRYQVMRNVNPAGAVSLRFGVDVGSYEESDPERGVAHFVEHMAFRSTRSYPDGSPDRAFAQMGVAFGRDQNAATSLFATTYQLDLPRPDPQQLAAGFAWLRDVADGVIFTDTAVNRERGVVLAEKEARNNPGVLVQDAIGRFQAPRQRSFNRSPIGTRETLNALRATDLQAFYQRWYRPEHAVVTVVGDLPVEALETLVRDAFASWTAKGPAPVRAALAGPDLQRPAQAMTVADATLPTAISACRLRPGASPTLTTVSQLRGALTSQIWQTILNQRLAERVAAGDAHLLGAVMIGGDARDLATTCLITLPTGEAWEASLQSTQAELRRFAEHGPTELEVEKTVELLRARLRGSISESGSRLSSDLANGLLNRALSRQTTASPADSLYAFDLAVEDLTPADVQARFAQDWSGSPPLLALVAPKVPKDEALLAAWTRNDLAAIAPRYADRVRKRPDRQLQADPAGAKQGRGPSAFRRGPPRDRRPALCRRRDGHGDADGRRPGPAQFRGHPGDVRRQERLGLRYRHGLQQLPDPQHHPGRKPGQRTADPGRLSDRSGLSRQPGRTHPGQYRLCLPRLSQRPGHGPVVRDR